MTVLSNEDADTIRRFILGPVRERGPLGSWSSNALVALDGLVAERDRYREVFAELREAYDEYYEGDGSAHLLNMESKVRALLAREPR